MGECICSAGWVVSNLRFSLEAIAGLSLQKVLYWELDAENCPKIEFL